MMVVQGKALLYVCALSSLILLFKIFHPGVVYHLTQQEQLSETEGSSTRDQNTEVKQLQRSHAGEGIIDESVEKSSNSFDKSQAELKRNSEKSQLQSLVQLDSQGASEKVSVPNQDESPEHPDKQIDPTDKNLRICSQPERIARIEEVCRSRGELDWDRMLTVKTTLYPYLLVDDQHKLLYCNIDKAGSTTWKKYIAFATGKVSDSDIATIHDEELLKSIGLRRLPSYTEEEQRYRMANYLKFMVVKHPYVRLRSTWWALQYYLVPTYFNRTYTGHNQCTMQEFIDIVVNKPLSNNHWIPYWNICKPCLIRYDHISKLETCSKDSDRIMNRLQMTMEIPHMNTNTEFTGDKCKTELHLWQYGNATSAQLKGLNEIYGKDVDMFGYSFNESTLMARCSVNGTDGSECC